MEVIKKVVIKKQGTTVFRFYAQHYLNVWRARLENKLPFQLVKMTEEKRKVQSLIDYNISIGDKVISRSNEPNSLIIGTLIAFEGKHEVPTIREDCGKIWYSLGSVFKFNDELLNILQKYSPIEQWNLCVLAHAELNEKYGIKYQTFSSATDGFDLYPEAYNYES